MIPKHAQQLIEAIEQSGKKLRPYDTGFMSSIKICVGLNRTLTLKQSNYLQEIYRKTQDGDHEKKEFLG